MLGAGGAEVKEGSAARAPQARRHGCSLTLLVSPLVLGIPLATTGRILAAPR
jgi:hypothetical protein